MRSYLSVVTVDGEASPAVEGGKNRRPAGLASRRRVRARWLAEPSAVAGRAVRASSNSAAGDPLLAMAQQYLRRRLSNAPTGRGLDRVWREFYRRHDAPIRQRIRGYGLSPEEVSDCAQEVWREVTLSLERFSPRRGAASLQRWILRIARSKAIDALRDKRRRLRRRARQQEVLLQFVVVADSPGLAFERAETRQLLRAAFVELRACTKPVNYQLFHMRWIEGHSVAEIASRLQVPPRQVSYRLARVMKKLRALVVHRLDCDPRGRLPELRHRAS